MDTLKISQKLDKLIYQWMVSSDAAERSKLHNEIEALREKMHQSMGGEVIERTGQMVGKGTINTIYSFPMKYHPIDDPMYFRNRDYIGKHWNRKFIRAIQAVLNATKGKIGRGKSFFEEAFGKDIDEYNKILWMPEAFIIYRRKYDEELRTRLADRYQSHYGDESNLVNEWWAKFNALDEKQLQATKEIVANNRFTDEDIESCSDKLVREVLEYYRIKRD